jgi:3,4-dihydroxy 2-butanone 4-phosphate synthase/GTP cyclohydrolase II
MERTEEGMDLYKRIAVEIDQVPDPDRRPVVILSYAQSLDGSIAARRGKRTQISGAESARLTHQLRAYHDAILVGIGTVLADDPRLTVRLAEGSSPQPVVLDSQLRTPPGSKLMENNPPWIATTQESDPVKVSALAARGVELFSLPANPQGGVHLPSLLETLHLRGIRRLMVEGGARVISSFLSAGLVDFLVVTISPLILGGLPAVQFPVSSSDQGEALRLDKFNFEITGDDLVVFGHPIAGVG